MDGENAAADPRFRVLLADDVANLRALVRLALELHGPFAVVAEAANGAEAVDLARRLEPDLVLLDLSMPVLDGLQAVPLVREASPRSTVVILSGFRERRLAPRAHAAGATAYLEKGIEPTALVERLVAIMREERAA